MSRSNTLGAHPSCPLRQMPLSGSMRRLVVSSGLEKAATRPDATRRGKRDDRPCAWVSTPHFLAPKPRR